MATFLATVCGLFVFLLSVVVAPASAQTRSDPGEPIRLERSAPDGSARYRAGVNTGYYRMLTFVNRDRPADAPLDEAAFDAANQCGVIYVCWRAGRIQRIDRNGSCPVLNGTSRTVDYETFCENGQRERWLVNGRAYFSSVMTVSVPEAPTPPSASEAPSVPPPPAPQEEGLVEPEDPAQPPTPSEQEEEQVEEPTAPAPTPAPPAPPTVRSSDLRQEEATVRTGLFILALILVAIGGPLVTVFVMRSRYADQCKLAEKYEALAEVWSPYGRGEFEAGQLQAALTEAQQHRVYAASWEPLFPGLPFVAESFTKVITREEAATERGKALQEAASSYLAERDKDPEPTVVEFRPNPEDGIRADYAERVTALEKEVRDGRNFMDHIKAMLEDLVPELEKSIRETRKMEHPDDPDGVQSRPSLPERETFCERKLRRLIAIQGVLAMALNQTVHACGSLAVARGLGYVSLDSARADRRPWFGLLLAQLLLGMQGRILRLQNDIKALNAHKTLPPPPAPTRGGSSIPKTLTPPSLGGNGQTPPPVPYDAGMGADPFPLPRPPKID